MHEDPAEQRDTDEPSLEWWVGLHLGCGEFDLAAASCEDGDRFRKRTPLHPSGVSLDATDRARFAEALRKRGLELNDEGTWWAIDALGTAAAAAENDPFAPQDCICGGHFEPGEAA